MSARTQPRDCTPPCPPKSPCEAVFVPCPEPVQVPTLGGSGLLALVALCCVVVARIGRRHGL